MGSSSEGFVNRMFQAGLLIDKYYTPLLCLFGALGNSLSLAVFCLDSKYRSQSSSYYLSALAVTDTGFLLNVFAVWLEGVHGGVITSNLMCPLVMYLGQVTCFLSIYLMVAFSIERYVAVHYPFARPRICTRSKARKTIVGVATAALLLFSYAWIIAEVVEIKPKMNKIGDNGKGESMWSSGPDFNATNTSSIEEDNINFADPGMRILIRDGRVNMAEDKSGEESGFNRKYFLEAQTVKMGDHVGESKIKRDKGSIITAPDVDNERKEKRLLMLMLEYLPLIEESRINEQNQLNHHNDPSLSFQDTHDRSIDEELPDLRATNETIQAQENNFANLQSTCSVENFTEERDPDSNNGSTGRCRYRCTVPRKYYKISEIANYLDTIFTLIIPFILITFLNVKISISVWKLMNERHQIVASASQGSSRTVTVVVRENSIFGRHSPSLSTTRGNDNFSHDAPKTSDIPTCSNGSENLPFDDDDISDIGTCHCHFHSQSRVMNNDRFKIKQSTKHHKESKQKAVLDERRGHLVRDSLTPHARNQGGDGSGVPVAKRECSSFTHRDTYRHQTSSEVRVTKTLLLVSTVFLFLNLPLHVIRCAHFIQHVRGTNEGKEILRALQPWATLLFNTNFAVNFLLYCVSGRNFRKSLRHIGSRLLTRSPSHLLQSSFHSNSNLRRSTLYRQKHRDFGEMIRRWRKPRSRDSLEVERPKCHHKRSQHGELLELEEISRLR